MVDNRRVAIELGKLEQVDPRTVWEHEAHDFTPWLLANADRLAEALGIDLELEAAEHAVGGYSLDLVGRDITNDAVLIVENQLAEDGPFTPRPSADLRRRNRRLNDRLDRDGVPRGASPSAGLAEREHRRRDALLRDRAAGSQDRRVSERAAVQRGRSAERLAEAGARRPQSGAISGKGALYIELWRRFLDRVHAEHPDWTSARPSGPTTGSR